MKGREHKLAAFFVCYQSLGFVRGSTDEQFSTPPDLIRLQMHGVGVPSVPLSGSNAWSPARKALHFVV